MPTLTNLVVNLTGDSSKLNKAVDKARRNLKKLGGQIGKAAKVGGVAGVALGGVAAAGIIAIGKKSAAAIDETAKLAKSFGITESQVKTFGLAAQLGGSKLNPMLKAMQRGTQNARLFALGLSESKGLDQAFKDMGLTSGSVQKKLEQGLAPAFIDLFNRAQAIEDPVKRLTATQELFGKKAITLAPALATLGQEYNQLAKFSEFWRGQTHVLSGEVENMNDQILMTTTAFDLFAERLTAAFAGPIAQAVIKFRNFAGEFIKARGGVDKFANEVLEGVIVKLKEMKELFDDVSDVVGIMASAAGGVGKAIFGAGAGIGAALEGGTTTEVVKTAIEAMGDETKKSNTLLEAQVGLSRENKNLLARAVEAGGTFGP